MAVVIAKEEDIVLTREEHERLMREWQDCNRYNTMPVSFETFIRQRKYATGKDKWICSAVSSVFKEPTNDQL